MLKTVKRMILEEWRTQSEMYKGRNFALLPFMMFFMSIVGAWALLTYSNTTITELGVLTSAFGFFTGLAAGSINFSGKDALENVLGPINFIIYSSRTLPVRKTDLFAAFVVKDVIYYFGLYLVPVALGIGLVAGNGAVLYLSAMFCLFLLGLGMSMAAAQIQTKFSYRRLLNYSNTSFMTPLTRKSVLDISRSSGGLLKIVFSFAILLSFYWYIVLSFPLASYLLLNPLLSFAVISGMMSVTIYNWLNTYDSEDDYAYLPIDKKTLLASKIEAFKFSAFVALTLLITASYFVYPQNILLALIISYSVAYYTVSATAYTAGLNPNERMLDAKTFAKFLLITNLLVMPLLALTAFTDSILYMLGLVFCMLAAGKIMLRRKTL